MTSSLPPRHVLSKSTFVRGCQCVKSLWLYKHHYDLRDRPTVQQQQAFAQGTDVGLLARQLFGSGVDASPGDVFRYRESVRDTAKYIAQGHTVIFEAAFQYRGVLCAVDILIKHKDKWYAYEVKSSTSVKVQLVQDAALQYYVISQAGLALEDIFIVHINSSYVRSGDLQLRQLFTKQSVKEQVSVLQPFIADKIQELSIIASQKYMPGIATGDHCATPYTCDFHNFCHTQPSDEATPEQHTEMVTGNNKIITYTGGYPAHFLEIFTYRTAVPAYDGHWPYRHIPYRFIIHTLVNSKDQPILQDFTAEAGPDPCMQVFEKLLATIIPSGHIVVANEKLTKKILAEMENDYPGHATELQEIAKRIKV